MASRMIACAGGIAAVAWFPKLLPLSLLLVALTVPLVLCRTGARRLAVAVVWVSVGLIYGTVSGLALEARILPAAYEGSDLQLVGIVVGEPSYSPHHGGRWRFTVRVEQWQSLTCCEARQLRLSYRSSQLVEAGQRWRMTVRLKRPRSFANPGGFDYARWLVSRGIHASGYVRQATLLGQQVSVRDDVVRYLREQLQSRAQGAILMALAVGERQGITDQQWTLFRQTGLSHLMAISGLHIGIAAGLGYFLGRLLTLALSRWLSGSMPLPALLALFTGLLYAWLAGFSIPTQRAWLMCLIMVGSVLLARKVGRWTCWACALLVVLMVQPMASLTPGFWLSFIAVAILLLVFEREHRWRSIVRAQWMLLIGLMPLGLVFFDFFSPLSFPVNLIAVPLFSAVIVPLILLALCFELVSASLAQWLWSLADALLALFMNALTAVVGRLDFVAVNYRPDALSLLVIVLLVMLLLLPRAVPARYLALLLCVPLAARWLEPVENPALAAGQFELQVLDVGQGLSVLIKTRNHVLVYDVGPAFGPDFNLAEVAVLPVLRAEQVRKVDVLVVSHNDNDHAGAYSIVRAAYPGAVLYAGESLPESRPCLAGQRWRWDGVDFQFLHPQSKAVLANNDSNNQSCVLLVRSGEGIALVPGDIEAKVESMLLPTMPSDISVLVAPHHGSKTSSSVAFVTQLRPAWVVFSAGYKHHFGHPAPAVQRRYQMAGSTQLTTAEAGRVSMLIGERGVEKVSAWRDGHRFYWQ